MRRTAALLAVILAGVATLSAQTVPAFRVYATAARAFSTIDAMVADLATADVVFIGEEHTDVNTHKVELALLQALPPGGRPVSLAMEMFERDAQEPLEHFQMGHIDEAELIREANAWPEYVRDYKPLVDFAITRKWPVVAANVPRAIAARVAEGGLDALRNRPSSEAALVAADVPCPMSGDYYTRFVAATTGTHAPGAPTAGLAADRYYAAQCVKDETMAESIAQSHAAGGIGGARPLVVMVNGAFHSDFRLGIVPRVERRLAGKRVVVISIQPTASLDRVAPAEQDRRRADYLIYSAR